jgi:hypothetical protein
MSPVLLTGDVTAPILHAKTQAGSQRSDDEALQLAKGPSLGLAPFWSYKPGSQAA